MRVVYIAGPFRGDTGWRIETNVREAEAVALRVWQAGAVALCPHTNTRHFHGEAPDAVFVEGTLELLRRCDAILMIDGWADSDGARGERAEAEWLGLPVFEDFDQLVEWIQWEGMCQQAM